MPLKHLVIRDFRCLAEAEFEPDPENNLIVGVNASGKTSILEAIAYLGRGRSFRGAPTSGLVRQGCASFTLVGRVLQGQRSRTLGVRNGRQGLEVHIDGEREGGAAGLAEALPLQVIDPEVHKLVAGGPEERRRLLDWIAFHVEHGYLEAWRRFRRALKQRNAALRDAAVATEMGGWDREFCAAGTAVELARRRVVAQVAAALKTGGEAMLDGAVGIEYRQGWPADRRLEDALRSGLGRDRQLGATQAGPQRADLKLVYDERQARKLVSRGQQKLLASCLVLAATEIVQRAIGRPMLMLLDDPAAELDEGSLDRLMRSVARLGCQVIATALHQERRLFATTPALFHVERGVLRRGG